MIAKWYLAAVTSLCQNICCAVSHCVNSRRATFTYRLEDTDGKWTMIVQLLWKSFVPRVTSRRLSNGAILFRTNYYTKYNESEIQQLPRAILESI